MFRDPSEDGVASGVISSDQQYENWTLDQLGNWGLYKLDLDGDANYNETGELNDTRVHGLANELKTRDIDTDTSVDLTLAHDDRGEMTDDGSYDYVYDLRGRLVEINDGADNLAAFTYNALGQRVSAQYDDDTDGDLDGSDAVTFFVYDTRWRIVATFTDSDSDPTEQMVYHGAGLGGHGGSSYIDSVILVDRDTTANGTLDQRRYPLQNWRADVSLTVDDSGVVVGWTKYDAYGLPIAMPQRDFNSDTFANDQDYFDFLNDYNGGAGSWNPHVDVDCDGAVTGQDFADWINVFYDGTVTVGRGHLRAFDDEPLFGYAGYVGDRDFSRLWHVRWRVLDSELGRWTTRDPLGYVDGPSQYPYASGRATSARDSLGLCTGCPSKRGEPEPGAEPELPPVSNPNDLPPTIVWPEGIPEHPDLTTPTDAPDENGYHIFCCRKAWARLNTSDRNITWGYTACCNGRKIICAFQPAESTYNPGLPQRWGAGTDHPTSQPPAVPCIDTKPGAWMAAALNRLTIEHEQRHVNSTLYGCAGVEDGGSPTGADPQQFIAEHCVIWRQHLDDIHRKIAECEAMWPNDESRTCCRKMAREQSETLARHLLACP